MQLRPVSLQTTLDDWIAGEAIGFSLDSPERFNAAVDRAIASLGNSVELLGFGEALHGGEQILQLRNRLFQRLVEAHATAARAERRPHAVNSLLAPIISIARHPAPEFTPGKRDPRLSV